MENKDTMQLFEDKKIRSVWDAEKEEWFFSIVDVVAVLTESRDPAAYWRKLKQRLKDEGNQTVTNCHALKMTAKDGKKRQTDVADTEQLLRIIQSIPSPKAEPFKLWLAEVGKERIEETIDPELTIDRAPETFEENVSVAKAGGGIAGIARKALEERIGKSVITSENAVQLNAVVSDMIESSAAVAEERTEGENDSD